MAGLTPYALRMTFETAALETPASSATSEMDGRFFDVGATCSDIVTSSFVALTSGTDRHTLPLVWRPVDEKFVDRFTNFV
jgi:hypothetical protein